MLPWAIRRRSASGAMSTSSIWSARADDGVGHGLALRDPGDPLDDVVERLEVLDVDRRDDVDAGVEQLLDVLPALLVARARGRWCGRTRRRAPTSGRRRRMASTSISVERRCRGARPSARGIDLEVADLLGGARPAVGLDDADDDVGAALAAAAALVEHGERLADAGRGAEVDAQRAARRRPVVAVERPRHCVPIERRRGRGSSCSTLTPGSPRTPSGAVRRCARRRAPAPRRARGRARRRPAAPAAGRWHRDVRVEAGARRGDGVDRHEHVVAEPVLVAVGGDPLVDGGEEVGVRRAEVRAARRGAVVAVAGRRRAGVEVLRATTKVWPISSEPTTTPSRSISDPLAVSFQPTWATAVTTQRVGDAADDGEDDDGDERRAQLADEARSCQLTPRAEMMMSMSLMPTNGATMPPRP